MSEMHGVPQQHHWDKGEVLLSDIAVAESEVVIVAFFEQLIAKTLIDSADCNEHQNLPPARLALAFGNQEEMSKHQQVKP